MKYSYKKQINLTFDKAVEKARESLKKEGFGVLTEIDVKKTLKNKLDTDYEDYIILGACNPPFAYEALKAEKQIGLLLPCNVIVYREDDNIFASAILPSVAMSFIEDKNLGNIAIEVEAKLKKAIDEI